MTLPKDRVLRWLQIAGFVVPLPMAVLGIGGGYLYGVPGAAAGLGLGALASILLGFIMIRMFRAKVAGSGSR